jgi:hypothetical protein
VVAGGLSSHRRLATVVIDQGIASVAWYVPVLLVGRASTPPEFGVFLVAFGALATALAVSRAMFGVVLGMDLPALEGGPTLRSTMRLSSGGVVVCAMLVAVTLGATAALLPTAGASVALLAIGALVVLPQDLARYTAVAKARPGLSLRIDLVWCLPPLLGLALDVIGVLVLSAVDGLALWVFSGLASVLMALASGLLARPRFIGLIAWWRSDRRRRDLGGESLLSGVVPVANGWGAALVGGAAAVASVRGAAMLFAPVAMLMLVLTLAAVPEAHRRGSENAGRFMAAMTGALTVAALAWGMVALMVPDQVGRGLLGESWEVARPVLPWVCVEYVGVALWTGGAAMLRYASSTRTVLRVRLGYAPAAVVIPVALLAVHGEPWVFAATLAALAWVVGPVTILLGWRAVRSVSTIP